MLLRTLGELSLESSDFSRPKPLLLLAYLALEGPKPRRYLADLFFMDTKDPNNGLSQALKLLRKNAPGAVEADSQKAWTPVACDATELLNLADKGRFEESVRLYQGPFAETLNVSLGEELEEWVYGTREFLARSVRGALLRLAEDEAAQGYAASAARQAERAFSLAGAPELEPEELERVYALLVMGESPRTADIMREAEEAGITLTPPKENGLSDLQTASKAVVPHNLFRRSSTFIGRELELAEVATLLEDDCRLLTLTGPGGIGKTRLALQAGWEALQKDVFSGGVHFVPLEAVTSPELVPANLVKALRLDPQGQTDPFSAAVDAIGDKVMLLILDNFEHLLGGASLVAELLRHCPKLKVLATSREHLNLEEEWVVPITGLPVPNTTSHRKGPYQDAVQLFVQRAKRASLHFSLSQKNTSHVLDICRAVGGSPLGIELAAAWVRVLPPEDIAREMAQDLDFLSTTSHSSTARHRSVRAAFEHSWNLLQPEEQTVLRGLSVFQGGFRRDAASEVVGATLPLLASLVDKSLLRVAQPGRYDRHPLIYGYAQEKLDELERARLQQLHAGFYLALAEVLDHKLQGPNDSQELEVLEQEHENFRAALRWSMTHEATTALRLAGALGRFWEIRGYLSEGRTWLEQALAHHRDASAALRAKALTALGRLTQLQGELFKAETLFEEGLELWRLAGDKAGMAASLNRLGTAALAQENYARAEQCFQESLELYEMLGDEGGMSILLNNRGELARYQNDFAKASEFYKASLDLHGEAGNTRRKALILGNLGFVTWRLGDNERAEAFQKESLALKYEVRDEIGLSYCFAGLAAVSCELDAFERAASLLGVVDALITRTKHQLDLADRNDLERTLALVRAQLSPEAFGLAQDRGRAMSLEEAVEYALGTIPKIAAPAAAQALKDSPGF